MLNVIFIHCSYIYTIKPLILVMYLIFSGLYKSSYFL